MTTSTTRLYAGSRSRPSITSCAGSASSSARPQQAIKTLETGSLPTREYLDYMFNTDIGMKELRTRMAKLRERIAELEAMKADAAMEL